MSPSNENVPFGSYYFLPPPPPHKAVKSGRHRNLSRQIQRLITEIPDAQFLHLPPDPRLSGLSPNRHHCHRKKTASADQTTALFVEEQTIEVAKTEVVISHQEEDVDEASQEVEQNKEEVAKGKDNDYRNLQNKPYPEPISQNEKNQVDQVWSLRKDKLSPKAKKNNSSTYMRIGEETVCLNAIYTLYPKQWLENEVINVYIQTMIQYFDTQHRACEDKEKIILADVFFYQYIGRAFNVLTRNMSSLEDFADRSSLPTGSEVKDYGLNSNWITRFERCLMQPNGYDCEVYMLVFMNNILREIKFPDLIDGNKCRYTIAYDILRLGVEP
ncbi:hypothetical protein GIB67_025101 [Kingdonia uniflora]|uniref:Ubiquitin-like protease family profile domain-containing protein n=1 Tax=Kingdonia uniflora TaxID=39325 RepID=A0A7J7N7Y3_9MAGN|nr:hypothetical protein GIB67_025101 [Kingdonia uniflora]